MSQASPDGDGRKEEFNSDEFNVPRRGAVRALHLRFRHNSSTRTGNTRDRSDSGSHADTCRNSNSNACRVSNTCDNADADCHTDSDASNYADASAHRTAGFPEND